MAKRILNALILCFISVSLFVFIALVLLNNFLAPAIEKKIRQFAAENFDKRVQLAQVSVKLPEAIVHIEGFELAACSLGKSYVSIAAGETVLHLSLISTILQKKLIFDEAYLKDWVFIIEKITPSPSKTPASAGTSQGGGTPDSTKNLFSSIHARLIKVENLKCIFKDSVNIQPPAPIELSGINGVVNNFSASLEKVGDFKGRVNFKGHFDSDNKGVLKAAASVSREGERVDFTVKSELLDADLTYFSRYYANTSFTIIKEARIDIASDAKCSNNELMTSHEAHIYNIKLNDVTPRPDDTLFTLPAVTVINFFKDYGGEVKFGFNINGPLNDPKFEPSPLIQKVLSKALGDRIAAKLKELPRDVAKMSEKAIKGDLDIGKESQIWFKEIEKRFGDFRKELKEKYDADKKAD
ncbi:MAG: hypothetical protein KKD29_05285 [Candidatus Omnitrophica bacterium]|nr:hypothetical protein [Candidatus Omnitrophota bacterium]MBU4488731.1 hypothetical protein [Candidatus Omnitrophota bacterium]MCG2705828.1 hypothetical protein [Candidatus Omnitrophota bacterium]